MPNENTAEYIRWQQEITALDGVVAPNTTLIARSAVISPECIGYEQGQIRPGKLGRWDMYYTLRDMQCPEAECLLVAGLSALEVRQEERREDMRDQGYDPDNPEDVVLCETLKRMTPEHLDRHIQRLEKQLGLDPVSGS